MAKWDGENRREHSRRKHAPCKLLSEYGDIDKLTEHIIDQMSERSSKHSDELLRALSLDSPERIEKFHKLIDTAPILDEMVHSTEGRKEIRKWAKGIGIFGTAILIIIAIVTQGIGYIKSVVKSEVQSESVEKRK